MTVFSRIHWRAVNLIAIGGIALSLILPGSARAVEDPEVIAIGVIPFEEMQLTHEKFQVVV